MPGISKFIQEKARLTVLAGLCLALPGAAPLTVQAQSRIPPVSLYQAMLKANTATGWIQFRNYNGKQLVYFTALQTLHCGLKAIRYSINSDSLDKTFPLVKCNPQMPYSLPPNARLDDIAISMPKGSADTVTVRVIWSDGSASGIATYEPCKNVGDQSCAQRLD